MTEVFWEFRYSGLFDTIVNSRYDGESFYLSLGDVFAALQLNLVQDPAAGTASGFFVSTDRPYHLDFARGRGEVDGEPVVLEPGEHLADPLGFFVRPEVLARLFGLELTLDERRLALHVNSTEELPVVAAYRRRTGRARQAAFRPQLGEEHAPLRFDRDRAWLGLGVVGYRLSTSFRDEVPRGSLSLRGGAEVLGGDAEVAATLSYAESTGGTRPFRTDFGTFRWRFVPGATPLLRQARAGRLSSSGLRSFSFDGVSLSNEPVQVERFFGDAPLRVETGPEWEVELYLNNQLVEARRADAAGTLLFRVPITYGTTQIRVVEYGPNGEVRESARRIQIPFTFVPRGAVRYTVDAGRDRASGNELVQAAAAVGLTSWLTVKAGVDYFAATDGGAPAVRSGYASLSARVGGPFVLTATAAPDGLFTAGISAYHASLLNYNVEFRSYGTGGFYHPGRSGHETEASVTAPLRFRDMPIQLRANLTERRTSSGRYDLSFSPEVSLQPAGAQVSLAYRGRGSILDGAYSANSQLVETRVGYSFPNSPGIPAALRGTLLSSRSTYDLHRSTLQSLSANVARTIGTGTRAQLDLTHRLASRTTTLGLRLQFTLPSARLSSGVQAGAGAPVTVSQDVSGAISFDAATGTLKMLRQDWVGRSAATLRLFLDANGNGRWDRGERVIPNGGVQFRRAISTLPGPGGTIVATNLLAYEQYSLEVDQSRIRNPLWVPRFAEFSFVADPNRHKVLDVPFFVSGVVTGSVLMEKGGEWAPVPGLRLHLRRVEDGSVRQVATFSDGTFDVAGLAPGEYDVEVDPDQLRILKAVSDPAVLRFTLPPSEAGSEVRGLDLRLRVGAASR